MKRILLLLAIVAATLTAEAQESFKFGNVIVDDFTHADYAVDTSMADAIVLDETVDALYYESGRHFAVNRSVKRKIKILIRVARKRKIYVFPSVFIMLLVYFAQKYEKISILKGFE